jgi:hypothetical protein
MLALTLAIAGCATGRSSAATPVGRDHKKVALFGDSLAWEAQGYFASLIRGMAMTARTYDSRGTAVCDWLSKMKMVEADFHPEAVELEFSGNALTPCMKGYVPASPAYYEKYRTDTLAAIDTFVPGGAHVFLIGAPIAQSQQTSNPDWDRINQQYVAMARSDPDHVTYVDAGAAVESPEHTFVRTLPCLSGQPCDGPTVNGVRSNVVRAPDGVHFCPVEKDAVVGVISPCPVYSSGAYRYAYAMAEDLSPPRS